MEPRAYHVGNCSMHFNGEPVHTSSVLRDDRLFVCVEDVCAEMGWRDNTLDAAALHILGFTPNRRTWYADNVMADLPYSDKSKHFVCLIALIQMCELHGVAITA